MQRHPDDPRGETRPTQGPKPKEAPAHFVQMAVNGCDDLLLCHLFWKIRHMYPEMGLIIEQRDMDQLRAALEYNKQSPQIRIEATHRGVTIRMIDKESGDPIIPQESEQLELDRANYMKKLADLKVKAPMLVNTLQGELNGGTLSNQSINAVCEGFLILAREPT